jgi:chorismate lyase/3-hydroxybenzoate synthase
MHGTSSVSTPSRTVPATRREQSDFGLPGWVGELLARDGASARTEFECDATSVLASAGYTLLTVRRAGAGTLEPGAFEACTREAYATIARRLREYPARHPVRFWNYIPDIHRPCGAHLDRYMCFNAGRFAACSDWLGGPDAFDRLLATGSGVGHQGDDLVIHALAAAAPGDAVENPRQIPAYRYSRRFGPRPPCFARATVVREQTSCGARAMLLVGGTASIRGEESVHVNDLRGQTGETLENLAALVRSASGDERAGLSAFRDVRVYHFRECDRQAIASLVEPALSSPTRIEYVRADLCRPELCVEIEGIAELRSELRNPESGI